MMKSGGNAVFVKTEQQPYVSPGLRSSKRNIYSHCGPIIRSGLGHLPTITKTKSHYRSCYLSIRIHHVDKLPKNIPSFNELISRLPTALTKIKRNVWTRESKPPDKLTP